MGIILLCCHCLTCPCRSFVIQKLCYSE